MKVLVVGAGSIGGRHIGNLLSIGYDLSVEVIEPSASGRDAVKAAFDIDAKSSIEAVVGEDTYDAAFVCSPNHLHVPHVRLLAEAGTHVFVEKPLSLDLNEALTLWPVLKSTGVSLMVGCNLRFHPAIQGMARVIEDGVIGRPLCAHAQFSHYLPNWRPGQDYRNSYSARELEGGGILLDAIHEPDYLCWLFGDVIRVSGMVTSIGDLEIDVEDIADYIIWHGERMYSHVHVDYLRRDKARGCELVGTEGTIVWTTRGKNPEQVQVSLFKASTGAWEKVVDDPAYDPNQQYVNEVRYFLDCIADGRTPMNGLGEAIHAARVLDLVRAAAAQGRTLDVT